MKLTGKIGFDNKAKLATDPNAEKVDMEAEILKKAARSAAEEVADSTGVNVPPTKKKMRLKWALGYAGFKSEEIRDLQNKMKTGPIEVRPESHSNLETFVGVLKNHGHQIRTHARPRHEPS